MVLQQYLQTIWTGELACPRRDLFMQKAKLSRRQKLEIKMQGYGGPIGDDDQMVGKLPPSQTNFTNNLTYLVSTTTC